MKLNLLLLCLLASSTFSRQLTVAESKQLMDAMSAAQAGDTILVAPGTYEGDLTLSRDPGNLPNGQGHFWIGNDGTASNPILVIGSDPKNPPTLKGKDISSGYVIHVTGDYVYLKNLVVTRADKGIVFDNSNFSILEGSEIFNAGAELVHIRDGSSSVIINKNKIWDSGNGGNGSIGEGIYVGTDQARWGAEDRPESEWGDKAISEGYGGYDWRVNNTLISCNYLSGGISAEIMDIKEGTTNTQVYNNVLVGESIGKKAGAASYDDSFIDIKGVRAIFTGNSFCDCGNSLDGYINEVSRASYDHIPESLTTDGHSKPWCDTGDSDENQCNESDNAIISQPFDPREECADIITFWDSETSAKLVESVKKPKAGAVIGYYDLIGRVMAR